MFLRLDAGLGKRRSDQARGEAFVGRTGLQVLTMVMDVVRDGTAMTTGAQRDLAMRAAGQHPQQARAQEREPTRHALREQAREADPGLPRLLEHTIDEAVRFLEQDDGRPIFLVVHTYRTHAPYRQGPEADATVAQVLMTLDPAARVDGGCLLEARAVASDEPAHEGAVRIDSMRTVWSVRPQDSDGTRSRVGYAIEIAPGPIPDWATPERFRVAPEGLIERLADEVRRRSAM